MRRSEAQIGEWDGLRARMERGEALPAARTSEEYGADIVRACETGEPFRFDGNVPNTFRGRPLIDNLTPDCCAGLPLDEIARLVDGLLDAHGDWIPR